VNAAIDHVFVLCSFGAPEAEDLVRVGFAEGPSNVHPGQGTACRRFVFTNAYLELVWVSDPAEAQSEAARPTRLWERWSNRGSAACPFGIILRPAPDSPAGAPAPFPAWRYAPSYMPPGTAIEIAEGTSVAEPEIFYLGFQRGSALSRAAGEGTIRRSKSLVHVSVLGPLGPLSPAAQALQAAGLVSFRDANAYSMQLRLDGMDHGRADLRPALPLRLEW
jgi:hypothetical protein